MDTLRLLSRGTKVKRNQTNTVQRNLPSANEAKPQLFADDRPTKRRRTDFGRVEDEADNADCLEDRTSLETDETDLAGPRSISDRQTLLKQHKIKIAWLKPAAAKKQSKRPRQLNTTKREKISLFPDPILDFHSLPDLGIPRWITQNVHKQGFKETTEVQMAAIPLLSKLESVDGDRTDILNKVVGWPNLLTVAPTGSGKTLAFLIPTLAGIAAIRKQNKERSIKALILAPTKELVYQIVNEGKSLVQSGGIKFSAYKKDMRLSDAQDETVTDARTVAKSDILVSTPGILHSAISSDSNALDQVQYLILDEADVLLDPLFREQTVGIWKSLTNTNLCASLWSATMGSNIEDLASLIIDERNAALDITSNIPFIRLVVGLKDSAVPNVQHRLIYAATEQGKLMALRQLLHPSTSSTDSAPVLRPPFIVFTQTIERAVALHAELLYDIPIEAGGISRIAVLHSDLSDTARDAVMTRFRKGEIWVLITTDLLSRGIDFRGVNGVVNYDIPSSSAAYVHRAGRTGRAGREGGIAVTLYSKEDIPYLKHVANVIATAQKGDVMDGGIEQWLLNALPSLSKNEKQKLKKHGVEARTARGMANNSKAARRARISTKSGYLRRQENNRKGAIEGSRRRRLAEEQEENEDDNEFPGFA